MLETETNQTPMFCLVSFQCPVCGNFTDINLNQFRGEYFFQCPVCRQDWAVLSDGSFSYYAMGYRPDVN
jgi:transposase-like protein